MKYDCKAPVKTRLGYSSAWRKFRAQLCAVPVSGERGWSHISRWFILWSPSQ